MKEAFIRLKKNDINLSNGEQKALGVTELTIWFIPLKERTDFEFNIKGPERPQTTEVNDRLIIIKKKSETRQK